MYMKSIYEKKNSAEVRLVYVEQMSLNVFIKFLHFMKKE